LAWLLTFEMSKGPPTTDKQRNQLIENQDRQKSLPTPDRQIAAP